MARYSFYFGVEIELISEPHEIRQPLDRRFYYEKLAKSLRSHGLNAKADSLEGRYRKHSEHYDKWFLTRDGSLGEPDYPAIPIEAVSPVLSTVADWQTEINLFWTSWDRVFEMPRRSAKCGSHIHYRLLREQSERHAPLPRRNNTYCQNNWETSLVGSMYKSGSKKDVRQTMERIWKIKNEEELKRFMQEDRRVMWNFEHTVPGARFTGTVEFRGGRGLRGPNRTKWWIAFVVSFIQLSISSNQFPYKSPSNRPQTDYFWQKIERYARTIQVAGDLPPDWRDLNESYSSEHWEDTGDTDSDMDEDKSDTSSTESTSSSESSDSDSSDSDSSDLDSSDFEFSDSE
ncbi:amidoligase enzyme-domain-containing protein [Penicillium crustosum]|uniref:amidoligase enzyme-domain-containing protein n=1 Tax=Penicillium crustosum TaxID=36656 RepID=UPI0023867F31|nr:amidoligase enzyme-domain-containing protein [Penicillium crustosum]KAJ5418404.1 amidoligase enzyme-domain-containing protein [Penicillium crustosum]